MRPFLYNNTWQRQFQKMNELAQRDQQEWEERQRRGGKDDGAAAVIDGQQRRSFIARRFEGESGDHRMIPKEASGSAL